jgi:hypothetical protein
MSSYMRNVHAFNNWIKHPMIRLQDGGGLYTNTPCPNCNVSKNLFEDDDVKYGCLYHDVSPFAFAVLDVNTSTYIHTSDIATTAGRQWPVVRQEQCI